MKPTIHNYISISLVVVRNRAYSISYDDKFYTKHDSNIYINLNSLSFLGCLMAYKLFARAIFLEQK